MRENEMVGWHHKLNGHEFEPTPGWWRTGKPGVLQSTGSQLNSDLPHAEMRVCSFCRPAPTFINRSITNSSWILKSLQLSPVSALRRPSGLNPCAPPFLRHAPLHPVGSCSQSVLPPPCPQPWVGAQAVSPPCSQHPVWRTCRRLGLLGSSLQPAAARVWPSLLTL